MMACCVPIIPGKSSQYLGHGETFYVNNITNNYYPTHQQQHRYLRPPRP